MESGSSSNKTLWILLGGAAALIGGALAYSMFSGADEDEDKEFKEDLEKLAKVEKDPSGIIKLEDFVNLFKLVTKHAKKKIGSVKAEYAQQRRKFLKDGNNDEYKNIVKDQMQREEAIYQDVANEAMSHFDIQEQEFMMSQHTHMSNPRFQQTMMNIQMGLGGDADPKWKPLVTKEKAKEIFKFIEDLKFKMMEDLAQNENSQMDQMEATIYMVCEHQKVGDLLFDKFGIEEEEFTKCIQHYELMKDPEIIRLMTENMQKLGPEAMAMIGGMPQM